MTLRDSLKNRLSELRKTIEEGNSEIESITKELSETPPDILDEDIIDRKNRFLRDRGYLPK